MDPMLLIMLAAARDPARWGPILDDLGPNFGPGTVIPGLQGSLDQFRQQDQMVQGPAPGADFSAGQMIPGLGSNVPGINVVTPPGGTPDLLTGNPTGQPDNLTSLLALFNTNNSLQPPGMQTPPPGPPGVQPPLNLTNLRQPNIQPQVRPPTAPNPVWSGGVTGAQKAPEIGAQVSTGGTPAQMLLAALMGGGRAGQQNPLRVPTLGALLGGGS